MKDLSQAAAIVLTSEVSLEDAFQARTVAQKVGYRTVRFFFAKSGAKMMHEVTFGPLFQLPATEAPGELVPAR